MQQFFQKAIKSMIVGGQYGLIINDTSNVICYSIGQHKTELTQSQHEGQFEKGGHIGFDKGFNIGVNASDKTKVRTTFSLKTQSSVITVQPFHKSEYGLILEPNVQKYLSIWIGSQEDVEKKIITNVKVLSILDIRLRILQNGSILRVTDEQIDELKSSPSQIPEWVLRELDEKEIAQKYEYFGQDVGIFTKFIRYDKGYAFKYINQGQNHKLQCTLTFQFNNSFVVNHKGNKVTFILGPKQTKFIHIRPTDPSKQFLCDMTDIQTSVSKIN